MQRSLKYSSGKLRKLVSEKKMNEEVLSTGIYCKTFNDLFDVMNSCTSSDKVPLRRPLAECSEGEVVLNEALHWLDELEKCNKENRYKTKFIRGFRQSIRVILLLLNDFKKRGLNFLSTRRLCQDLLEAYFGKIRSITTNPTPHQFVDDFAKVNVASLMTAPLNSNCEQEETMELTSKTLKLLENPPQPPVDEHPLHLEEEELLQARTYAGQSAVGSVSQSASSFNGAAYFSGFMAKKLVKEHKKLKNSLYQCSVCSKILSSPARNVHLYVILKQYSKHTSGHRGLKYCSSYFISFIRSFKKVFLYCFEKYRHLNCFTQMVTNTIERTCDIPMFCCTKLAKYLIRTYVRARTYQSVNILNKKPVQVERMKKKLHSLQMV